MSDLFNKNMSYPEAQRVFFAAARGKSGAEFDDIKREYLEVLPAITEREMSNNKGRLTSHPLK